MITSHQQEQPEKLLYVLEVQDLGAWYIIGTADERYGTRSKALTYLEAQKLRWEGSQYFGASPLRIRCVA